MELDRSRFLVGALAALAFPRVALAREERPLALVTADLEAHVVALDLRSGHVRRRIPTQAGPRSIESSVSGELAVVGHTSEGTLSLIDGRTLEVLRVVRGLGEPRYTAIRRDGRYAFVSDSQRGELVALELPEGRIVDRIALDGPARHLSINRAGDRVWTALGTKARQVALVDVSRPERLRSLGRITPPFLAHDVGFTPGGARVWVTSGDRGRIAVYGARSGERLFVLAADAPPQHVSFIGERAYVASGDDGTLRVHRLDGRLLHETRIPLGSYNVQVGSDRILTPSLDAGTLCVLDPSGRLLRRVRTARSSHDACAVVGS